MTISTQVRLPILAAFGRTFGSNRETRDSTGAVVTAVTVSATNAVSATNNGCQLGSIITWRSDFPLNPFDGVNRANTNTPAEWFNKAAFTLQALYTFGDAGRNTIIGPASFYWDSSTRKSFRMPKEGRVLQFRCEAFNSGLQ
jgi:hypothetical protein